jgi:protein-tyrosine-phosphatase
MNLHVISSGTDVNWDDPQEREYFDNTLAVLQRHSIKQFAKNAPEQLTQQRIDTNQDVIVLMNQRVIDEASKLVTLPNTILNWNIIDIGEGHRTNEASRELYEEEIYQEITQKVDELVSYTSRSR